MRLLILLAALLLASASASAADARYATVYAKVEKGERLLVAIGIDRGDCIRIVDPPKDVEAGIYLCYAVAGEPVWACVARSTTTDAAPPQMIALPQRTRSVVGFRTVCLGGGRGCVQVPIYSDE